MAQLIFPGGSLELRQGADGLTLEGLSKETSVKRLKELHYLVTIGNITYELFLQKNAESGKWQVRINDKSVPVELRDDASLLLERLGMTGVVSNKHIEVKAPMPGLILDVAVQAGGEVKAGDVLLVLEAMKMENLIKASSDGIIEQVLISKGDRVEKNQALLRFQ